MLYLYQNKLAVKRLKKGTAQLFGLFNSARIFINLSWYCTVSKLSIIKESTCSVRYTRGCKKQKRKRDSRNMKSRCKEREREIEREKET